MRRSMFTLSAALILVVVALPLMAQSQNQPYENPTNPNAPSITQGSGLTITGTVVSWTDTSLVLDTASGQRTIQLTDRTQKPSNLKAGETVGVDYTRSAQGVMIAKQVRPQGSESSVTSTTSPAASTAETTEEANESASEQRSEEMNTASEPAEGSKSDLDQNESSEMASGSGSMNQQTNEQSYDENEANEQTAGYTGENLPSTGSDLPLLGLLGLLSLAGAAGIRTLTR